MSEAKQRLLELSMIANKQALTLDGRVLTSEMTAEALNTFRGPQGPKGNDGSVKFEELTDEQKEMLRGPRGFDGPAGPEGPTGAAGARGADGYTPQKGVDYWIPADKAEMVNDVLAALPNASGVSF